MCAHDKSVMPFQVSIYCAATDKECDHSKPTLTTITNGGGENHNNWPPLRRSASDSGIIRPEQGALAQYIAQRMECSSCFLFTNLAKSCHMDNCRDLMHVLDVYSSAVATTGDRRMVESSSLCWHSTNPFVLLALDQNNVVISNSLVDDPRVVAAPQPPAHHVPIQNVMVVPLVMSFGDETRKIGAVLMINKRGGGGGGGECGGGFTVADYARQHHMFADLTAYLLVSYYNNEIKRFENQIEQTNIVHAREMTELAASRDTFIATMSHEIRTPLNAINGYNEILMKTLSSSAAPVNKEMFANSLRNQRVAVLQLTQIIGNILDFSKLKSKSMKLDSRPFSIRECVRKAVTICMPDCDTKHINLSMDIRDDVPETLLGDELRIFQVVMNLLTNAVKYTSHGYIALVVSAMVGGGDGGKHTIQFSVRDSGKGVPIHLQERIFDDFLQIRDASTTAAAVQGVGLGLSISRELVTLMGGKIWVDSDGRSGSMFTFTLSLRDVHSMARMISEVKSTVGNDAGVLIVDDLEVNRVLMCRMFLEWKFVPHACSTIEEAMYTLDAFGDHYFRIVVIDMDIAGDSGLTLARRISKHRPVLANLILIAASSLGSSFAGSDEFDAVHVKPLHADDMLADIVRLLHSGPTRRIQQEAAVTTKMRRRGAGAASILIVDDDRPSLEVTKSMLMVLGYKAERLQTVASAREALKTLENAPPDKYACVLMDLVMPGMNGIECTRIICQEPARYGTPVVIALTADAVDSTRTQAMNAGAKYFVSKPVSLESLAEAMTHIPSTITATRKKVRKTTNNQ